jgi:hypothetical protein
MVGPMAVPGYKWVHIQWPKKLADEVARAKGDEPLDEWLIGAARMRLARDARSAPESERGLGDHDTSAIKAGRR